MSTTTRIILIIAAAASMSACANVESRPVRDNLLYETAETRSSVRRCPGGRAPTCTTRMGRTVECACLSRDEFEAIFRGD